jgi:reverse transcriptase-like protein/integrase-like protein
LPAEKNYSTPDKELLAIVQTLKKFRHYLQGTKYPVIVKSDHQNLKTFTTTKVLNARQARWVEELSSYDFVIEHVKGKENVVADSLSRRPDYRDENPEERKESLLKEENGKLKMNTIKMITMESHDEDLLKEIRKKTDETVERDDLVVDANGYKRFKGLIFIPKNMEEKMIEAHHDGVDNGHPGISRVMEKIQRSFYFPGMYRKVKKYISACDSCNRNKFTHHKPFGKMMSEDERAKKPWEFITADFVEMPSTKHFLSKEIKY